LLTFGRIPELLRLAIVNIELSIYLTKLFICYIMRLSIIILS